MRARSNGGRSRSDDAIAAQDTPDGSRQSYLFLIQSRRVSENDVERVFDAKHKC